MSAFLCSAKHISVLANYARYHLGKEYLKGLGFEGAEDVFKALKDENLKSLKARYGYHEFEDLDKADYFLECLWHSADPEYKFIPGFELSPLQVIKLAHSYDYQTCEHKEYSGSRIQKLITAIILYATTELEGYEEAEWAI